MNQFIIYRSQNKVTTSKSWLTVLRSDNCEMFHAKSLNCISEEDSIRAVERKTSLCRGVKSGPKVWQCLGHGEELSEHAGHVEKQNS